MCCLGDGDAINPLNGLCTTRWSSGTTAIGADGTSPLMDDECGSVVSARMFGYENWSGLGGKSRALRNDMTCRRTARAALDTSLEVVTPKLN